MKPYKLLLFLFLAGSVSVAFGQSSAELKRKRKPFSVKSIYCRRTRTRRQVIKVDPEPDQGTECQDPADAEQDLSDQF